MMMANERTGNKAKTIPQFPRSIFLSHRKSKGNADFFRLASLLALFTAGQARQFRRRAELHAEAKRKHPKGEAQEGPSEEGSPALKKTRAWLR